MKELMMADEDDAELWDDVGWTEFHDMLLEADKNFYDNKLPAGQPVVEDKKTCTCGTNSVMGELPPEYHSPKCELND